MKTLIRRWASTLGLGLAALLGCVERGAAPSGAASPSTPTTTEDAGASGTSVLGPRGLAELELHGESKRVELSTVKVSGQPFSDAFHAEIKEKSTNPYDVQLQARTTAKVEKGDALLATFYFRTEWAPVESAEGQTEFVFELAREPWTKSASFPVKAARAWKKIYVPFVAEASYAPGEAQTISSARLRAAEDRNRRPQRRELRKQGPSRRFPRRSSSTPGWNPRPRGERPPPSASKRFARPCSKSRSKTRRGRSFLART